MKVAIKMECFPRPKNILSRAKKCPEFRKIVYNLSRIGMDLN